MSDRLDRALEVLDVGLQTSSEHGYPAGSDVAGFAPPADDPDLCARCQLHRPDREHTDLCHGCRSFLLGDTDDDPAVPGPPSGWMLQVYEGVQAATEEIRRRYEINANRVLDLGPVIDPALADPGRWASMDSHYTGVGVFTGEHLIRYTDGEWRSVDVDFADAHRRLAEQLAPNPEQLAAFETAIGRAATVITDWITDAVRSVSEWLIRVQSEEWYQGLVDAMTSRQRGEPPSARDRERELLDRHRRSHRRTNRWGPPPGRR